MISTSMLMFSFKYLTDNFKLVSSLSIWIHNILSELCYTDHKIDRALHYQDIIVVEALINRVQDRAVLGFYFLTFCNKTNYNKKLFTLLKILINNGLNIHLNEDIAFINACRNGIIPTVKLLLKHGANIHAYNELALFEACRNENEEIVTLLLDSGADVTARNNNLSKFLIRAQKYKLLKMIVNKLPDNNYSLCTETCTCESDSDSSSESHCDYPRKHNDSDYEYEPVNSFCC